MAGEPSLILSERFYSIQGESTWAGLPCLFIRLAGCNLRCNYCDSRYTWEETGTVTPVAEILKWTDSYPGIMVELTGGEPLIQENIYPLMDTLLSQQRTVLVETNGSLPIEKIPQNVHIILDLKCPGSGAENSNNWQNIHLLRSRATSGCRDEIKFVLSSREDFSWAKDIISQYNLCQDITVLFSANGQSLPAQELAELILREKLPVRLQLQLHRQLWPEIERGV